MNADDDLTAELNRLTAAALGQDLASGLAHNSGGISSTLAVASTFANVDVLPPEETRLAGPKKLILRVSRLFMHRQAAFNVHLLNAASQLNHELTALRSRTSNDIDRLSVTVAALQVENDELREALGRPQRADTHPADRSLIATADAAGPA